jgi:hypothetical protein
MEATKKQSQSKPISRSPLNKGAEKREKMLAVPAK